MKKENFWWYNIKEKKFVEDSGCRRRFGGLVCFLSKAEIGWCVVEATTGSRIGEVCFTKEQAIASANAGLARHKDRIREALDRTIAEHGESPWVALQKRPE